MFSMTKRAVAAATLAVAVGLPLAGTASAGPDDTPGTAGAATLTDTPEAARPAFYEPPATIPSTPGTPVAPATPGTSSPATSSRAPGPAPPR